LGLESIKQAHVDTTCTGQPGCRTYFSDYRGILFHYLFIGHYLVSDGEPSTVSGKANLLGNNAVVTLGQWTFSTPGDAQVGDNVTLAGTILHELAHNLGGLHGGIRGGLNCNPNNESVLNYLYQRGLITKSGTRTVDLNHQVLNAVHPADENESSPLETFGLGSGTMPYRLRWYAPLANVAQRLGISPSLLSPAKHYCGSSTIVNNSRVLRVDGSGV